MPDNEKLQELPFGILSIDLAAIAKNYQTLRKQAGPACSIAGVVKANGYGTGAEQVAATLADLGCNVFFVATPQEGLNLRRIISDENSTIAVLGGAPAGNEELFENNALTPVINSLAAAERWGAHAHAPVILHFDSGMNRLGLDSAETSALIETNLKQKLSVAVVMSHFASADDYPDGGQTTRQFERFMDFAANFPEARKSVANSAGLFRDKAYALDLARPGIALYGGNPGLPENPMKPVVQLAGRVLQIRHIKKGESIGYGATQTFSEDSITATLGLGYADGFLRSAGNKGRVFWQGQPCPIAGRISMDLTAVDITKLDGPRPQEGDMLEIIGPHQSIDALAQDAGTISYEILTGLGRRYQRVYKA